MKRFSPFFAIILVCCAGARGQVAQTTQPDPQLIQECDILVENAIVRSYGIAWGGAGTADARAPLISYAPGGTPAVGWVLWEAGRISHEPKYSKAAIDVARGIINSQEAGGKIPDTVRFGMYDDRGQDAPRFIPDRASTCAGLGLLLTILHDSPKPDARLRSCALLAARWLSRQETLHGAWAAQDAAAEAVTPGDTTYRPFRSEDNRMIRLDRADWRDSTLGLLLSADVLKNPLYAKQAKMATQMLLDLHIPQTRLTGTGCWTGAYAMTGVPRDDVADAPLALDTLATRYCLQTLLAEAVCAGDVPALERVHVACKSLRDLRDSEGTFLRFEPLGRPTSQPVLLASPPDEELPEVLHVVEVLDVNGLSAFGNSVDVRGVGEANGIDEELARILCGAGDDLFNEDHASLGVMAGSLHQTIAP